MTFQIEARASRTSPTRGRASVHIVFDEGASMTVSNIEVREEGGTFTLKLPPAGRRPDITFQGELKRQVEAAVKEQFQAAACRSGAAGG